MTDRILLALEIDAEFDVENHRTCPVCEQTDCEVVHFDGRPQEEEDGQ